MYVCMYVLYHVCALCKGRVSLYC